MLNGPGGPSTSTPTPNKADGDLTGAEPAPIDGSGGESGNGAGSGSGGGSDGQTGSGPATPVVVQGQNGGYGRYALATGQMALAGVVLMATMTLL